MKQLTIKKSLWIGFTILTACSPNKPSKDLQKPNITVDQLNTKVDPGDDFYAYSNTHWMLENPIPDDKSRYGTFDELAENSKEKLRVIFDELQEVNNPGSIAQKIADFYNSGMDSLAVEKEGIERLQPIFEQIESMNSKEELPSIIGYLHSYQLFPFFYYYSTPDNKNSNNTIAGIYQSGLGLPDRDYYLLNDDATLEIQKAYQLYLQKILSFSGEDEKLAKDYGLKIYNFENQLANVFYTRLQNRDPYLTYNKISGEELSGNYGWFNWNNYFEAISMPLPAEIDVSQTSYLKELGNIINSQDLNVIKKYLKTFTIRSMSSYLPSSYVNAKFDLYGKVIEGKSSMQPRWKRIQNTTNGALGEAIGQLFVEKYFPPKAKERMVKLVENPRIGFEERIEQLSWMSDETKLAAKDKLAAIGVKIGYPDKWRDYSQLQVTPDSYLENVLASNRFDFIFDMNKIGKPVNKEEWHMFPQTVNAYYNPSANEIVFPAAILQPPFFYMDGDDAVNYGAIGVVIGHEMTHGFDDQGSKYDKYGNLSSWWTPEDSANFVSRTQILVDQFNQFPVSDSLNADGAFTLGENIADLGGLNIAYAAYLNAIKDKGDISEIDGLNDKQRFYLGYANIWAQNIRKKEMIRRTKTDPHSLGKYRVNGPLPNIEAFYKAFDLGQEAAMFIEKDKRANIW